jgi:hypothetical protein
VKKTILVTLEMDVEDRPMSDLDKKEAEDQALLGDEPLLDGIENYSPRDMADGLACAIDEPEASAGTGLWFTIKDVRIKSAEWKA